MTTRIAVLGCGPAGLAAVHAINRQWHPAGPDIIYHIYSKKRKSQLYGAQYLHAPLPWLPKGLRGDAVDYLLKGTAEQYRAKVYGGQAAGVQVSPQVLQGVHQAWDIRATYDQLWDLYSNDVSDIEIDPPSLSLLLRGTLYDLVINTLPLQSLCSQGHQFTSQAIYAKGSTSARPARNEGATNFVLCNGEAHPGWYRHSVVFGYETYEWPGDRKPPVEGVVPWSKPIKHNCTCWAWPQSRMLNVGRYGAWRKGYLVHHVFEVVTQVVHDLQRQQLDYDPNTLGPWAE